MPDNQPRKKPLEKPAVQPWEDVKPQWQAIAYKLTELGRLIDPDKEVKVDIWSELVKSPPINKNRGYDIAMFTGTTQSTGTIGKLNHVIDYIMGKEDVTFRMGSKEGGLYDYSTVVDAHVRRMRGFHEQMADPESLHNEYAEKFAAAEGGTHKPFGGPVSYHVARFDAEPRLEKIEQRIDALVDLAKEDPQQVRDLVRESRRDSGRGNGGATR